MKFSLDHLLYLPSVVKKHLIVISIGFVLGILTYTYLGHIKGKDTLGFLWSGILGILIGYLTSFLTIVLNRWISWKKYTGFRLLLGVLSTVVLAFVLVWLSLYLYSLYKSMASSFNETYNEIFLKLIILIFFISLVYNVIYFALHSYYQYAKGQMLELKLERKQTELQLTALKSQLSPHFLFNSINTVSSLIFKDVNRAELFIRELAKSYQYTLNKYENKLVKVSEELGFVDSYYFLLKTRFDDRIQLDIDIPDKVLQTKIPPLTLQMLVENAVKHNQMISAEQKLVIAITYENNSIHVSNRKTTKPKNVKSFGIGLSNIRSRYGLLANKAIEIIDNEHFVVKLPVIL